MIEKHIEIGGSFWLSDMQLNKCISYERCKVIAIADDEQAVFTSSGRGAIKLLLNIINPINKRVLLPSFTCDSVLQSFREGQYELNFFLIDNNLSININDFISKIESINPSIVFLQSYFGLDTLKNIRHLYDDLKKQRIIVVEDITHSWLSDFSKDNADYYIVSFHKWFELPDGGAVISVDRQLNGTYSYGEHSEVINLFRRASELKNEFMQTGKEDIKMEFRPLFYKIDDILDQNTVIYRMSDVTVTLLNDFNYEVVKHKRRENYLTLLSGLSSSKNVIPLFDTLPGDAVPLYFPIFVINDREDFQKFLARQKIYCPIHWPIPVEIEKSMNEKDLSGFRKILSVPCDQRYDDQDMKYIIEIINNS